jgi:hypothetical protein
VLVNPALAAAVEALEAERLAPVPRASHIVGVDVDDLALVLEHTRAADVNRSIAQDGMSGEVAAAHRRLDQAIRGHAARGIP